MRWRRLWRKPSGGGWLHRAVRDENSIISGEESVASSPCFCTGAPTRS